MNLTKQRCLQALFNLWFRGNDEDYELIKQLIKEYFDLVERITPVQASCVVGDEMVYHAGRKVVEDYVKHDITENMVELLLKENVVEFRKEEDYARFQTIHKGKIYIVKPKGDNDETN